MVPPVASRARLSDKAALPCSLSESRRQMPAVPAWPPRSAPRLFVGDLLSEGAQIVIEGSQAHYLGKVMRVAPGDGVIACDDRTGEWACEVLSAGKRDVILAVRRQLRPREDVPDFVLCAALLKKPNFDLVLEKATELGVAAIRPLVTRRCVADKLNPERALSIVSEAAEQCARTALPRIEPVAKLEALLRDWPQERTLFFADEQGGEPAVAAFAANPGPAALLVGPEGGFDEEERALVRAHPSARAITLGPRILRAETACISAIGVWMATTGDWSERAQ